MKRSAFPLLFFALTISFAARADVVAFIGMPLTAGQEVPAVASTGYGSLTALYDTATRTLNYHIAYQLPAGSAVTAAHFHGPAALGVSAGVQIGLNNVSAAASGKLTGSAVLTPAQETDLLAGKWYFNVHSAAFPSGELRAQLIDNTASAEAPRFANNILSLPSVLVPGAGAYRAELGYNGSTFSLNAATPLR